MILFIVLCNAWVDIMLMEFSVSHIQIKFKWVEYAVYAFLMFDG